MYLDPQYKHIVKATTGKDTSRPVLQALHVKRTGPDTGELAAADGLMLAVVPCTLDADDVPGLISADCLTAAFKSAHHARSGARLILREAEAVVIGGATFPRPEGQFPNYDVIVPRYGTTTTALPEVNPILWARLYEALGTTPGQAVNQADGDTRALLVHTATPQNGQPVAPYGVIMPMQRQYNGWLTRTDAPPEVDHSQCVSDHSRCADRATLEAVTRERDDARAASQAHLARVQELLQENAMLTRDNETMTGLANTRTDQRDTYATLLDAAERKTAPVIAGAAPNLDAARAYVNGFISAGKRTYAAAVLDALVNGDAVPDAGALDANTAAHIARKLATKLT